MKKYLLLLVVTLGLTIAHAQVVPKNKPVSNADLKSSADKIDTMPAVVRRIVRLNDSVFVFDRESLQMRVAAKDWPNTPLAKKIGDESNLNEASPAVNARLKANVATESNGLPEFKVAVKRNDSIYIYSNGKLLMKRADKSKTSNGNTQATVVDGVPIPVLLQQK